MFYLKSSFGLKNLQAQCEPGINFITILFYSESSITWVIFFFLSPQLKLLRDCIFLVFKYCICTAWQNFFHIAKPVLFPWNEIKSTQMRWWDPPSPSVSSQPWMPFPSSFSIFLGGQKPGETQPLGSLLLSWSTSGLYIRPLINPQWKPSYDILTGQAPVLDRSWFIATESQVTLIYFSSGEEGKLRTERRCWMQNTWCAARTSNFWGLQDKRFRRAFEKAIF